MRSGGSAAVVTTGDCAAPVEVDILRSRGPLYTSSFEMEVSALELALAWCERNCRERNILVCTDSQSCLVGLSSGSTGRKSKSSLDTVRELLYSSSNSYTLQWIPGHTGLIGNEMADREAKLAAVGMDSTGASVGSDLVPVSFGVAKSLLRRTIKDPAPSHDRTRRVYSRSPHAAGLTRKEAVALAQLRTGHSKILASYRVKIGLGDVPTCHRCGHLEEETLDHFFRECPALDSRRLAVFGCPGPPLTLLVEDPQAVARFLKELRLF